jgi:CRP-like cAMP-binding protein
VAILRPWEGSEVALSSLGPGDCFGEMALIDFCQRSASVRAEEDAHAIEVPAAALHRLYKTDLEQFALIQMNMGREVTRRLRITDQRLFEAAQGRWADPANPPS